MNEERIYECIDIGQNKYKYMHETFDEMLTGLGRLKLNKIVDYFISFYYIVMNVRLW